MNRNYVNELVKLCLDLAELADKAGEESTRTYIDELGLGYRAFTSKLRRGVKEIIDLQAAYHSAVEKANLCRIGEKEAKDFVEDVFGDREAYAINDKDKKRIKDFVRQIEAEWEKDDE